MTLLPLLFCLLPATGPFLNDGLIFPPNDKHNHGSSIVESANGDLIACWFHGSGERNSDDVLIQGARKRKGEAAWSEPFVMADTPDLPDCNPVLFIDPRGVLWLFWITVQDNQWGGSLLKYRTSKDYAGDGPPVWDWQDVIHARPMELEERFTAVLDDAETALAPLIEATPGIKEMIATGRRAAANKLSCRLGWMTRVHPVMTSENRMMLGLYSDVFNCSLAAFTEDWGETWSFSYPILDPEAKYLANIQPSFAIRKSGEIVAFMRDNGIPKYVRTATSNDGGVTWSRLGMLSVRNPGTSVETIVLQSGRWVMICNDTLDGRHVISAYLSEDEGETWPHSRAFERYEKGGGSFSYPSVIQAQDGTIHATYSYSGAGIKGSSIKHVAFNEDWVLAGD